MKLVRFKSTDGYVREGELIDGTIKADREYAPSDVEYLAPCEPTKIVCIGLNYEGHIQETGKSKPDRPMLFLKGPNTISAHNDVLTLPDSKKRFDHEAELGVVIDKQCKNVERSDARDYIRGYTCFNDLSNRDDQEVEQNWVRGKAFDNAAPVGPVLSTPDEVPSDATIEARVNGEVKQKAQRNELIFSIPELIEEITQYLTLEPGDVIATGTPRGISSLGNKDRVEVEVEGIGTLKNVVQFP